MIPVKLESLTKLYGTTIAVDNVDLFIEPGELFFLLGPSGCGKTTLLRMIAGLIEPTAGSIYFGGRNVTALATGKRNAAMVFQSYALWPHLTVAQNVAFGLDVRKVSGEAKARRVAETLAIVRMEKLGGRKPAELSGGQQQRVALARALVVRPDVLLLDEPLSNLDAKLRHEMRVEIRRICTATRVTAVYVTHDQDEALSMADRIAVMHEGVLCQVGTPAEIYRRPSSWFVADFVGQTNAISGSVSGRNGKLVTVETPVGSLASSVAPEGLNRGESVTCCIRPEAIRLGNGAGTSDNTIRGALVHTVYLGHIAQHRIESAGGVALLVSEPHPTNRPRAGAETLLSFAAEDVVVLRGQVHHAQKDG